MKTKKILYIFLAIDALLLSIGALYLNRAYAHIYDTIGGAYLRPPLATDTNQQSATSTKQLTYVALGDSLTAGTGVTQQEETYPYIIGKILSDHGADVIVKNFSVPGARTHYLNEILLEPAIGQNPDIVTILIGINDMHGNVAIDQFTKEYEHLLQQLTTRTQAQIYAVNIPFLGTPELLWPPYGTFFDYRTQKFNKVIKELAQRYNVMYVDLYSPTVATFKQSGSHYSVDVFHPSAQGYAQWADIISHAITY